MTVVSVGSKDVAAETQRVIVPEQEAQRLWNQLTHGMDGIYRVAQDYATIGMGGDPLPQLTNIHNKLGKLIAQLQERSA